jgi:DNA-binding transcriptional regulator YhcF (GntR family)
MKRERDNAARGGVPKYKLLRDFFAGRVRDGSLRVGDALPSINALRAERGVSRDTVVKAYAELKRLGLVDSAHGKEFYVVSKGAKGAPRLLILLDELSMYKQRLVDGLREALGDGAELEVLTHGNRLDVLKTLYLAYAPKYEAVAAVPAYELEESLLFLAEAARSPLLILDRFRDLDALAGVPAVYQDFERGVQEALASGFERLRRYRRVVLLRSGSSHIIDEIERGFKAFLKSSGLKGTVSSSIEALAGDVCLTVDDRSLVELVKFAASASLTLGRDIGSRLQQRPTL